MKKQVKTIKISDLRASGVLDLITKKRKLTPAIAPMLRRCPKCGHQVGRDTIGVFACPEHGAFSGSRLLVLHHKHS